MIRMVVYVEDVWKEYFWSRDVCVKLIPVLRRIYFNNFVCIIFNDKTVYWVTN